MDYRDYYATLGVKRDATPAEIKRAFRKLARQHHPDLKPGDKAAESKFKEINEANEVLSDPDKRSKYDMLGANWEALSQAGAGRQGPAAGEAPGSIRSVRAARSRASTPGRAAATSATSSARPVTAAASVTSSGRSSGQQPVGRRPLRPAAGVARGRSVEPASRTSWPASTSTVEARARRVPSRAPGRTRPPAR